MTKPKEVKPLRGILKHLNFNAKKSFGQHFLFDQNLTDKIAQVAIDDKKDGLSNFTVIEIGPGPGGLTQSILREKPKQLYVIERDLRYLEPLTQLRQIHANKLIIIIGDAMTFSISNFGHAPRRIIANLPYNISTALLIQWLKQINNIDQMTLMFQTEVVKRITAQPSCKSYGRLSVITQWLCKPTLEFHIDKRAFVPAPKVGSSLVTLKARPSPLHPAQFEYLEKITALAFGQRRKMLRSSLRTLDIDIPSLGIDQTARPENLSIEEFCLLAQVIEQRSLN
jgi:16S rRNA (adenine1518-N6/adenine1519-N6)-dimethyltransferase